MATKRILLITIGRKGDTSYNMFNALGDFVSERYECRRILITSANRTASYNAAMLLWSNIRNLKDVAWSDTVLVHVASALATVLISAARLLGKKVVIFQWDIYPTTLAGVRYRNRLVHRILYAMERFCLARASLIVVPSDDFLGFAKGRRIVVMPLWPQSRLTLSPITPIPGGDGTVHIAFAGQVNELRGLQECIAHLGNRCVNNVVLHVFSANELPAGLGNIARTVRVEGHGVLPREELQSRLTAMHFGLVSLNPAMDQPGFPSKTFDYIASGLPILYFGRPLPAYTASIEDCGIGVDITNKSSVNLHAIYQDISRDFAVARQKYLSFTGLEWRKFAEIC